MLTQKTTKLLFVSLLILLNINFFGQKITGTITDQSSFEPIPFANILNTTTKNVIQSDLQGKFTIESANDSLTISAFGFTTQTVIGTDGMLVLMSKSAVVLDEIIVTVSRDEEKRTETPVAISTINTKQIEDNKPTSIDQVLNQTPGVYMVNLGNEQHSMSIRQPMSYGGVYLYLEDGLPIRPTGVFNHNALLEMNMGNVNRIELIRGPASSMYGAEAIGGAVNFISNKPTTIPTAKISVQGNNLGYKRTDFNASTTHKKLGVGIGGYYAQRRDGYIDQSDFDKLALSLNLTYQVTKNAELVFTSTYVNYVSDMSGSLDSTRFYEQNYESAQTFTNRKVQAFRSKLQFNHYWENGSKSSIAGYLRDNTIKQNPSYRIKDDYKPWTQTGDPNLAHGEQNDNSYKSYGFVAQHSEQFKGERLSALGGVSLDYSPATYDANYISVHKTDDGIYDSFTPTDSMLADYDVNLINFGAYGQLAYKPTKNLKLVGGLRFDNFVYDYSNNLDSNAYSGVPDSKDVFSKVTPKLGLTYDLKNHKGVYANYSQGFVPPQVGELYRGVKVPELGPATYNNYEFGGWTSFAKKKGRIEVSLYRMDGTNEIISVRKDDGSTEKENAGQTRHQGVEYSVKYELVKGLQFRFGGTNVKHTFVDYNDAGNDYSGNSMPGAPAWIANSQITFKPQKFIKGFRISLEWQHINNYYMDAQNTQKYKGYDVFNLRMGYEYRSFELWANIMNVSNQLYATNASASAWGTSYTSGEPINLNLGIAYRFKKKEKTN